MHTVTILYGDLRCAQGGNGGGKQYTDVSSDNEGGMRRKAE